MPEDERDYVSRSEFYRALGLLYFIVGWLSFWGIGAVSNGNPLWLVPWALATLGVFGLSFRYFIRSRRATAAAPASPARAAHEPRPPAQ
jgi:hypothetical protein